MLGQGRKDGNTLTIGIFATMAQHERELISSRTRAALQAKIAQGAKLGRPENLTPDAQRKGVLGNARRAATNENNCRAWFIVDTLRQAGKNYSQITQELNRNGYRTSKGCLFTPMQVRRVAKWDCWDKPVGQT